MGQIMGNLIDHEQITLTTLPLHIYVGVMSTYQALPLLVRYLGCEHIRTACVQELSLEAHLYNADSHGAGKLSCCTMHATTGARI